jgi:NADP-dependent 3-hydroxy acid dehydrogenase YdfG
MTNIEAMRRAVVITGASSGIGRAIAVELAAADYDLFLLGRSADGLDATKAALPALREGVRVQYESLDVGTPGELGGYLERLGNTHPYLFAVINNAGVMYPEAILSGGRMELWRRMMDVNYFAPLEGCVAAIKAMRRHGRAAHLINISSVAAEIKTLGPYAASKAALEIVSATLRAELQRDPIRITVIAPGAFNTQLSRDFLPETGERLMASGRSLGFDLAQGAHETIIGDPKHIAQAARYILAQPAEINIERVVIRPPMDLTL